MQRYTNMLENQALAELQDRIYALELKLKSTEEERKLAKKEKTQLRKERLAEMEQSEATVNSLKSALEDEKKRRLQEEQSSPAVIDKAGSSAVEAFRSSEAFTHDLGQLTLPNYMFGYTTAIKEVAPFLTAEQVDLFKDKASYNEDTQVLCDRMAEGTWPKCGKSSTARWRSLTPDPRAAKKTVEQPWEEPGNATGQDSAEARDP